ncbi:hypothetical protein VTK73DRAFT_7498 [Phialemonium thermophilum]|uniref:Uncharacterized protein n=1 Tax=Phialemonium thermophilum TaxID=223376 RepID=A0ABR3WEC5_9PEZI
MSTPQRTLTIAVIGYGTIGPNHVAAIQTNPDVTLVAIVEPRHETASIAAELSAAYYPGVSDLLSSPHKPDAAIICTPNQTHAAIATELSSAGVHVLIEKPFCHHVPTGQDLVRHLRQAREEKGVKALVGHHRRFNPYAVATAETIASGSLGQIIAVNGLWMVQKSESYFEARWRRDKSAGPVMINVVHDVDLLHLFLGPIVRVQTEKSVSRRGYAAEEGGAVIFKFKSGAIGTLLFCDNCPSPYGWEFGTGDQAQFPATGQDFYRVFGTEGTLSVPDLTRWSYDGVEPKNWNGKMTARKVERREGVAFELQLAHFVRVIRGEEDPRSTPESGLAALMVCEAIKKSLETGTAVDIEPYELS